MSAAAISEVKDLEVASKERRRFFSRASIFSYRDSKNLKTSMISFSGSKQKQYPINDK